MHAHLREIARTMLRREWEHLPALEKHVLEHVQARTPIARNTNQEFSHARTRALHEKLDELRERSWTELLSLQQEQVRMLGRLLEARTTPAPPPPA